MRSNVLPFVSGTKKNTSTPMMTKQAAKKKKNPPFKFEIMDGAARAMANWESHCAAVQTHTANSLMRVGKISAQ
jgi:hypothetical protein